MYLSLQPSAAALPSTAVVSAAGLLQQQLLVAAVGQPSAAVESSASAEGTEVAVAGSLSPAATAGSSSVTCSLLFHQEPWEYLDLVEEAVHLVLFCLTAYSAEQPWY